jgi:predicted nucleic acid-binding protein
VVDASVWIARFVPSDAFHHVSRRWLSAQIQAGTTLIAPSLLLVELAGNVARILDDTAMGLRVANAVTRLAHVRLVPLDAALAQQAYMLAATSRLRGADAVYAAVARQLGVQLISWDKEHVTRAGAARPTV